MLAASLALSAGAAGFSLPPTPTLPPALSGAADYLTSLRWSGSPPVLVRTCEGYTEEVDFALPDGAVDALKEAASPVLNALPTLSLIHI